MFDDLLAAIDARITEMNKADELYVADVSGDELWGIYLRSFVAGTNPMFRERTEHDCCACRNFIKHSGKLLTIENGLRRSVWDVVVPGPYEPVVKALDQRIRAAPIAHPFRTRERQYGAAPSVDKKNYDLVWKHLFHSIPNRFVVPNPEHVIGPLRDNYSVLRRSIEEITLEACDDVLEMIQEKQLYRGEEHRATVEALRDVIERSASALTDSFCWEESTRLGYASRFKNTVIGTLLVDLSTGMDIEQAIKSFDSKMGNYKRTSAVVTKSMIDRAEKRATEMGIIPALARRHANQDDITVNNVLYVDRSVRIKGNMFDDLRAELPSEVRGKPVDLCVDEFISGLALFEGPFEVMIPSYKNLVSLIAPVDADAPNILQWGNNFSWTYVGDVTDSGMKQRVASMGGQTVGTLRFSIQWNENGQNGNDMDAHCIEPCGNEICFRRKVGKHGALDVDVIHPQYAKGGVAVENIIFPRRLANGKYQFYINTYTDRGGRGVSAEIEFDGQVYEFHHGDPLRAMRKIPVATVTHQNGRFTIDSGELSQQSKWDVHLNKWIPVDMILMSPNHWDDQAIGNKHVFFILHGCKNPDPCRGLYNEYLDQRFREDRKVFDHLGRKLRVQPAERQLSGVGFSSTLSNSLLLKHKGGILNIKFGR